MQHPDPIRQDFIRSVTRPEPAMYLARTALIIAAESDPNVDVDGVLHTIDSWAEELRRRLDPDWNNLQKLARLRSFVFEELGFKGERRDYYNPSNSLLHEVVKTRRGVPLTLSIVFMEIGWRLGIPFEGVGFPGHFLVRLVSNAGAFRFNTWQKHISKTLAQHYIGLEEIDDGIWSIYFCNVLLARLNERDYILRA